MTHIYQIFSLITLLSSLCFVSCSTKEEIKPAPTPRTDLVKILQLTKPDYKPYIIAQHVEGHDSITYYNSNLYGAPAGKNGYSPYWELANEWFLVDWKWELLFPNTENDVLLINETWENARFSNLPQKWPQETPHIKNPISHTYYVRVENLEKYLMKTYNQDLFYNMRPINMPPEYPYSDSLIAFKDSAWTILQTDISTVIKDGALDLISQKNWSD